MFEVRESIFITHPDIAKFIQLIRLKGKIGKLRKQIGSYKPGGIFESKIKDLEYVKIYIKEPKINYKLKIPSKSDVHRFVRSVYCLAFNCLAYENYHLVMNERYDKVRNYIRKGNVDEIWNYAYNLDNKRKPEVLYWTFSEGPGDGFCLSVFGIIFHLDFQNTGQMNQYLSNKFSF